MLKKALFQLVRMRIVAISFGIIAATVFSVPLKTWGIESRTSMEFPTETAGRASIMYIARKTAEPYEKSRWSTRIVVTSYNSTPEQTDDTPFITASGTTVRDGIIASNYLPIGTRVRFPDLYGGKVFTVEDRMNSRYHKRADIWSEDTEFSKHFGARYLRMEVL